MKGLKSNGSLLSIIFCCFYAFILISHHSHSQENFSFTTYSTKDGLGSSQIQTLFQDSKGYLWIGHKTGVSRFNGRKFVNFSSIGVKSLGQTYCIREYESGVIFIGTENGLFIIQNGTLAEIALTRNLLSVYSITDNEQGGLWIGTSDGPINLRRDELGHIIKTKKLTIRIESSWQSYFGKPNPAVYSSLSSDGSVFFADGYEVVLFSEANLKKVWKSNNTREQVVALIAISKDSAFIASNSRLYQWINGEVKHLLDVKEGINSMIWRTNGPLLYTQKGIQAFNIQTSKLEDVCNFSPALKKWGNSFLQDMHENFWLATPEQLILAKPIVFSNRSVFPHPDMTELYSIKKMEDGKIFCGTTRGRVLVSSDGGRTFHLYKTIFSRSPVVDFFRDGKNLWISSWFEGIARIRNGKVQRFTRKEGLRDNSNFTFLRTGKRLFTGGDGGVTEIIERGEKILFKNYRHNTGSSNYASFRSSVVTNDNKIFFGSNMGIFRLDNDTLTKVEISGTGDFGVTDMKLDNTGLVWIATAGNGIFVCESRAGQLIAKRHFIEENGLISGIILNLLRNDESMMAAGYSGVSSINKDLKVRNLGTSEGFIDRGFHYIMMEKGDAGAVWFATTAGLFMMDGEMSHRPVPFINIIASEIIGDSVVLHDGISLKHHQNSLKIKIDGIDYRNPSGIRYKYRLMGLDTTWSDNIASDQISFQNLNSGKYIFEVIAINGEGAHSPIDRISFNIRRPFWQTWWFRIIFPLLLITVAIAIIRWKIIAIRKKAKVQAGIQEKINANLSHLLEIEQVINYFATSIAANETEEGLLWDVVEKCISRLGFEDCVIYVFDKKRNVLVQKAAMGSKTYQSRQISNPIEIRMGEGIVGFVALSGKAEIIVDTRNDPRYLIDDSHRNSEIAVPVISHNELIGIIDSESSIRNFYTERHLQILKTIAALCADKITIIRTTDQRRAAEIKAIQNHHRALEAKLMSLRLQMNPHFLFNALNSIQQLILTGDDSLAARSLSRFSKLLRLVMLYSEKEKVSLRDELDVLGLYIELESLRFGDTFSYSITVDEQLDAEELSIPPLIIQPIVENAIWHGLLHKEGKRELKIAFSYLSEDLLHCEIRDNGIGRENADKYKVHENSTHTGKGISSTRDRLNLLSEQSNKRFEIIILDLIDDQGNVCGTAVDLIIAV